METRLETCRDLYIVPIGDGSDHAHYCHRIQLATEEAGELIWAWFRGS
jgi:hypothetical protein